MLSTNNQIINNDLILVSNKGNEIIFDKKLTIKFSKVIKTILEKDNDEDVVENKIPIMFDDNIIKILNEYITYINNTNFNYIFKPLTLKYIFTDFLNLKNNNNIIIWNFIDKLSIENTSKFFDLSRYLNIEILEELTLYNLMIKIKNKEKVIIDKLKNKINYIDNKIEIYDKNLKSFIKINNFNKVNWLNIEYTSTDNSSDSDESDEDNSYKYEINSNDKSPIFEDINSILDKSNNDKELINDNITKIKKNLNNSIKKYIDIYKSDLIFLNEKKKHYLNKIKFLENELTKKILDLSDSSQNLFFVDNTCFCKSCYKVWFLSSLYNDLESKYDEYKKSCEVCVSEILGQYEELNWDITSLLINKGFEYNDIDKEEYIDENHRTDDFSHLKEKIFKRNEYNIDFIKYKCLECYFEDKEFIKCGDSENNFCNDIIYKCCKYNFCTEHIDNKKKCSNDKCNNNIYICDNCIWDYNCHKTYHDLVRNKNTSICRNCEKFYCKNCIRGRFCKLCSHIAYDYHSDYD
jgi:hypothetical protein